MFGNVRDSVYDDDSERLIHHGTKYITDRRTLGQLSCAVDSPLAMNGIDEIQRNVSVAVVSRQVQGAPTISVRQSDVGTELYKQFNEFKVSIETALVKRRLAIDVVSINVNFSLELFEEPV